MKTMAFDVFQGLYEKGNYIPVYREILADMETPVSVLRKFLEKEKVCFLLESVEHGTNVGRYSFVGIQPTKVITGRGRETTVVDMKTGTQDVRQQPVLDTVNDLLREVKFVPDPELEGGINGFIGFLSFENVGQFEEITFRNKPQEHYYDSIFFMAQCVVVFDHLSRRLRIINVIEKTGNARQDFDRALAEIEALIATINGPLPAKPLAYAYATDKKLSITPQIKKDRFVRDIEKIKQYIKSGDAIQVVYSQRFDISTIRNPFNVYRTLRTINPSPYMYYVQYNDTIVIGSSPEVLVKKEKNKAIVRPIAGTRKRGDNEAVDKKREEELKKSPKENAEHLMLVDLSRNDIGLVCKYGTIKVEKLAYVEKYSHVMHLVSNVEGFLKSNENSVSLLKATFPAGTVSGAPKIRAMQIIDEMEDVKRGPYAGALGYIGFCGDMDMCIMIRSLFIEKGKAFLQAGAGIVYDSNPEKEYEETLNKANALFCAIEMAHNLTESE